MQEKNNKLVEIKDFSHKEMEYAFSKVMTYKEGYLVINTFEEVEQKDIEK